MKSVFRNIFLGLLLFTLSEGISAQCTVSIETASDTVPCGDSFDLIAVGEAFDTLLYEDFNNSSLGTGWTSTGNVMFSNPCGPTLDGTPAAWFGSNPPPRELITVNYDLTCGGEVCFDLDFGSDENNVDCEDPDASDEGVYFQYSTDNGATWVNIFYFDPNAFNIPNGYYSWDTYCFNIPPAAQTTSTMFRWHQPSITDPQYDHWGIDNVQVLGTICGTYTYGWGNPMVPGDSDTTLTLTQNQETFTVTYTDGVDTCTATKTIYSALKPNLTPDTLICGLTDLDLTINPTGGTGNYNYEWSTGNTTDEITVDTTSIYWIEITDVNYPGCVSRDSSFIEIYPNPQVDFSVDPLCQGAVSQFTDLTTLPSWASIDSWSWNFDDQGATSTDQNPGHPFSAVGDYYVNLAVVTEHGCTGDTTITVTIEPSPYANFTFNEPCAGEEVNFVNESLGDFGDVQWTFGDGSDTSDEMDPVHTYQVGGTYYVELIIYGNDLGCNDTMTKPVNIGTAPNVYFTADPVQGEPPLDVEFYNESTGAVAFYWDFVNGNTSNSDADTLTQTYPEVGFYEVVLNGVGANGCPASFSLPITVYYPDLSFEIPNVFTPNGDNSNDQFLINYDKGKGTITSFDIVILNRWGNVVYTSNDPEFKWTGTTQGGRQVTEGTYFYKVNFETIKGTQRNEHGFVQVVRTNN